MGRSLMWFPSFAAIPDIGYRSPLESNRRLLPGYDAHPRLRSYSDGTAQRQYLIWPSPTGETSASPAHDWVTQPQPGESEAVTTLRQMHEALALPGTPSDYHFRLQGCCSVLWRARLEESYLLTELETGCLFDLRLLELHPEILSFADLAGQNSPTLQATTFEHLVALYEHEGLLQQALAVAQRGQRLNQGAMERAAERLSVRVAQLYAEDTETELGVSN